MYKTLHTFQLQTKNELRVSHFLCGIDVWYLLTTSVDWKLIFI